MLRLRGRRSLSAQNPVGGLDQSIQVGEQVNQDRGETNERCAAQKQPVLQQVCPRVCQKAPCFAIVDSHDQGCNDVADRVTDRPDLNEVVLLVGIE